jgi:hypothetical protein
MLKKAVATLALLGLLTPGVVKAGDFKGKVNDFKDKVKELTSQTVNCVEFGLGFTNIKRDRGLGSIGYGFYLPVSDSHFLTTHAGITVFHTKEVGGEIKIGVAQLLNISDINFITEFNAGYTGKVGWSFGLRSYVGSNLYLEFSRAFDENSYLVKFGMAF